jgi:type IV pilus assembly protein PilV
VIGRLDKATSPRAARLQRGFSLVEVMVALVVVSLGLLGVAKMQALALASTGTAKMRSLAAIEAASLVSTMHADRNYWSSIAANLTVNVSSAGAISSTQDPGLNTAPASQCQSAATPCTSVQLAAQDLSEWATTLVQVLPGLQPSTITCTVDATGKNPVTCKITLSWVENVVALNTSTSATATTAQNNSALTNIAATQYALYTQP